MMNNRPIIGMMPSRSGERMILSTTYHDSVWRAGGWGVILSYTTDPARLCEYVEMCDGFIFAGGVDLNPKLYGEEIQFDSVEVDDARDAFEQAMFNTIYPTGKPILGICRGIQAINVFLGGTLYQHIDGHHQGAQPGNVRTQPLHILSGSMFERLCGKTETFVNSYHHENIKDLAPSLAADAVTDEGRIEAVHAPDYPFLFAVQFHPEIYSAEPNDDHSAAIFKAFVDACRK